MVPYYKTILGSSNLNADIRCLGLDGLNRPRIPLVRYVAIRLETFSKPGIKNGAGPALADLPVVGPSRGTPPHLGGLTVQHDLSSRPIRPAKEIG